MTDSWTTSSTALPPEGALVEFRLEGRDVAMEGTYQQRTFCSRWSDYQIERVSRWRSAATELQIQQHSPIVEAEIAVVGRAALVLPNSAFSIAT